jgi:hypothetical protein
MAVFKCKMCGGDLEVTAGTNDRGLTGDVFPCQLREIAGVSNVPCIG